MGNPFSNPVARRSAFTLVEVVIVIAVVALLAAIIVPMVAGFVDDGNKVKAQADCKRIALAINRFYKDLGIWPTRYRYEGVEKKLTRFFSAQVTMIAPYGFSSSNNDNWADDGNPGIFFEMGYSGPSNKIAGTLGGHLVRGEYIDHPEGGGVWVPYPKSGNSSWQGPYSHFRGRNVFGAGVFDPWGHPYICNIDAAYGGSGAGTLCVVISAGPNGYFDSPVDPDNGDKPQGDDIWAVVHIRE